MSQILSGGLTAAVLVLAGLLAWGVLSPDPEDTSETAAVDPAPESAPKPAPEVNPVASPETSSETRPATRSEAASDAAPVLPAAPPAKVEEAPQPAPTQSAVAPADPVAEPAEPELATAAPDPQPAPSDTAEAADDAPAFDVIRVDPAGGAVVAGSAAPGETVRVLVDGEMVAETTADRRGNFVALFDLAPSQAARSMTLEAEWTSGAVMASKETALVSPFAGPIAQAPAAPQAILRADATQPPSIETECPPTAGQSASALSDTDSATTPETAPEQTLVAEAPQVVIVSEAGVARPAAPRAQPARPGVPQSRNVVIDTISYDAGGEVILLGRAVPGREVRIYLNNALAHRASVAEAGIWQARVTGIKSGLYTLRADEVDANGAVLSRFETPFERAIPEDAVRAAAATQSAEQPADDSTAVPTDAAPTEPEGPETARSVAGIVTVQPGFTLWQIARENYGEGTQFVRVFDANRDRIRNPDLIYPGQVFTVPEP
ncbi:LysM peptidoglycan-binding domain-containing protein [Dinoroseobacter sp. S375]|uniref:LysM peptidoglycan-binding domain-containing protein n=1 Tax=Dinoroseobacter sp. S375 TaxID=3415136 RepID=UPI003C7D586F